MPLYEYQCDNCGNNFEVVQRFNDEPLTACDTCGGEVRRVIFPPHIFVAKSNSEITVGHLADRNRSRFSDDKKESILRKNRNPEAAPLPVGMNKIEPGEKPWWEGSKSCPASQKEIKKMTPKQKKDYIEKGTK